MVIIATVYSTPYLRCSLGWHIDLFCGSFYHLDPPTIDESIKRILVAT
jgi:hypothetical protein